MRIGSESAARRSWDQPTTSRVSATSIRQRAMMSGEMLPWVLLLILALAIVAVLLWPLGRLPWP